jgi:hypothetical protein
MSDTIELACILTHHDLKDRIIDKTSSYKERFFLFFSILILIYIPMDLFFPLFSHGTSLGEYFGLSNSLYKAIKFSFYGVLLLFIYLKWKRNDALVKEIAFEYVILDYKLNIDLFHERLDLNTRGDWILTKPTTTIIDETLTQMPEVSLGSINQSITLPLCVIDQAEQSKHFIVLEQKTAVNPNIIFLKKDAITYADFQRLKEAIPCLRGLSVDPQQFKQETISND